MNNEWLEFCRRQNSKPSACGGRQTSPLYKTFSELGIIAKMKRTASNSVYDESVLYTCVKTICTPLIQPAVPRCVGSIFFNFFFRQYRAALLPGRVPVSWVDHPLDEKIPFKPAWVTIYLDFITFWIRMLTFLLRTYGRRAFGAAREFLLSIGKLYAFAAQVYGRNFSTTRRPFYIARPRFFLIHLVDPHLMCIPSLHVMVVIQTWTQFAAVVRSFGDGERFARQIAEMKQGALAITMAILFVKQHSVNCVAAALYAMTVFNEELFPPEEAAAFVELLFGAPPTPAYAPERRPANYRLRPSSAPRINLPAQDIAEIKSHIINLYRRFLSERPQSGDWAEPLLKFLSESPQR